MLAGDLGPSQPHPIRRMLGAVRIPEDLRRSVLFLGFEDADPDSGGIRCCGTAFLMHHDWNTHLVTVRHVARSIGDSPFLIRVNMEDGSAQNRLTDREIQWHYHPDPDVDVAVSHFPYSFTGCDVKALPAGLLVNSSDPVGIGDMTYTIGLFRLLQGKQRNVPVVHSGNIALLPSDELIPVDDWDAPGLGKRKRVRGYLVESQSLEGLSGSPVFVRTTFISPGFTHDGGQTSHARLGNLKLLLLGLWQGAWDAKADAVLATDRGREMRVPVGMGVVVPATKLLEVLDMPELRQKRQERKERLAQEEAASLDVVPRATDANPTHREDFMRLVGAAARKREPED